MVKLKDDSPLAGERRRLERVHVTPEKSRSKAANIQRPKKIVDRKKKNTVITLEVEVNDCCFIHFV